MRTRQDVINDGLDRLQDLGFTMEPFFSEHGPMVVEAMSTMGENDQIADWVGVYWRYRHHLPPPPTQRRIEGTKADRRQGALGDFKRASDWLAFFRE
jgi:hypothetical protein